MKFRTTVIILFVMATQLYSQNLKKIFKDYLPDNIAKDHSFSSQVSHLFEEDSKINPNIIYFRINYLNNRYSKNIPDNNLNGLSLLNHEINKYKMERNEWIESQVNILNEKYHSNLFYRSAKSYLKNYLRKVEIDIMYQNQIVDTNQINYFVFKFLSNDSSAQYDSTIDYSIIRKETETEKKNYLVSLLNISKNSKSGNQDILDIIFKYWYLFKYDNEGVTIPDIIISYYEKINSFRDLRNFTYSAGFNSSAQFLSNNIYFDAHDLGVKEEIGRFNYYNNLYVDVTYRKYFKKYLLNFSYIDFSLIYSVGLKTLETVDKDKINKTRYADMISDKPYIVQFNNMSNFRLSRCFTSELYLKTSVPLLVISSDFIVDGGFIAGARLLSYKIKYNDNYEKRRVEPNRVFGPVITILEKDINKEKNLSNTDINFFISPQLGFNISILDPLILQLDCGNRYLSIYLGLAIK